MNLGALVLGNNRSVIGISLEEMNDARKKIGAAQRKVNDEKRNLSNAIRRLQVDSSSRRLRMSSNELSIRLRKANQMENKLNKMAQDIDYTVRRFREVDKRCASRIKSVGLQYRKATGLLTIREGGSLIKNSLLNMGNSLIHGDFNSLINQGKNAWGDFRSTVNAVNVGVTAGLITNEKLEFLKQLGIKEDSEVYKAIKYAMTRRDAINAIPFKIAADAFKGIVGLEDYGLNNPIQFYCDIKSGRLAAKMLGGAVEGVVNDVGTIFDWRNFKNFMTNSDASASELLNYGTSAFNIATLAFGIGEAAKASQGLKGLGAIRGGASGGESITLSMNGTGKIDEVINALKKSKGIANEGNTVDKIGESVDDIGKSVAEVVTDDKIFKFSEMSEEQLAKIVNEYRGKAPIEIPETAKMKAQSKVGYEQIAYKWNDGTYKYEARWHTRTPEAPIEQGNTWVIQKTKPGSGGAKPITEFKIGEDEWIPGYKWYDAIAARKAGTATPEQISILDRGHWKE